MACLVIIQTTQTFSTSVRRLFCFLMICMFTEVSLYFKKLLLFIHSLANVWPKIPSFLTYLRFQLAFVTKLIYFWLCFKERNVPFPLSLEHSEAIIELLIVPILVSLCLSKQFTILYSQGSWSPKQYNSNLKDHCSQITTAM